MKILGKEVEPVEAGPTYRRWSTVVGIFLATVKQDTVAGLCTWDLSLDGGLMMVDGGHVKSSDPEEAVRELNRAAKRVLGEHDTIRRLP